MTRVLIRDLAQVASPAGRSAPLRGRELGEVHVIENAYVLCDGPSIVAVGRMKDLDDRGEWQEIDGRGLCAIPGLVDCHTHACFTGDRVEEFDLRAQGVGYEELHEGGFGIMSTVRATRGASEAELTAAVERHAGRMLRHGTTTFESKSGYGLDREVELAQLRAIRAAGGVATWLGGHMVAPEFDSAAEYISFAVDEVLPEAATIAEAADIAVEWDQFPLEDARRFLSACHDAGLALRIHGDQFDVTEAIPLALEFGARSVDHLEATSDDGIAALAGSDVAAVLLPASALFIGRPMPRARALVDAGAIVAVATDFNPGSAYCDSMPLVCSLATVQLGLAPAEALAAATVNAAFVLGRAGRKGRIAPGFDADLALLDAPDWRYLAYHLGSDVVATVIQGGHVAHA